MYDSCDRLGAACRDSSNQLFALSARFVSRMSRVAMQSTFNLIGIMELAVTFSCKAPYRELVAYERSSKIYATDSVHGKGAYMKPCRYGTAVKI
jgi:hypothetical protein